MTDEHQEGEPRSHPWLRRADQACVGAVMGVSLLVIGLFWFAKAGHRGELIEIDQAAPLTAQFQVDVNQAEWPEIMLLPGVGESLAQRIVESRERDGPYRTYDDLLRVEDIGPKTLERIQPYLRPLPAQSVAGPP